MGKPALALMDSANRMIDKELRLHPDQRPMSDLEKNKIALKYVEMNMNPHKFNSYKRFISNKGDVLIPGFNPNTGEEVDVKLLQSFVEKLLE